MASLPKHERYVHSYQPNDYYWGLGIENETYLELDSIQKPISFLLNQKRERYSVDYWTLYKPNAVTEIIKKYIKNHETITLPILLNGHTLAKTDRYGEPQTTYSKTPQPNKRYCGSTLLEDLSGVQLGKEEWWTLDGDTIEFMTQNYYKVKMEDVLQELGQLKQNWLNSLRNGLSLLNCENVLKGNVCYPRKNYGFAIFLTNRNNIAIFNNGTYHINITIPTQLNAECKIADMALFKGRHQAAARLFQWISPFFIGKFGSPDVFANLVDKTTGKNFPTGSQRLCASRYVSVGTYDTNIMTSGKILLIKNQLENTWYNTVYNNPNSVYNRLDHIGVDINYNKHWNHGLEFRIFDWFPESLLPNVFRILIWMCDESLRVGNVCNPRDNAIWNTLVARVIMEGTDTILTKYEACEFKRVLDVPLTTSITIQEAYDLIWKTWADRWNRSNGTCSSLMIREPLAIPDIGLTLHNTLSNVHRYEESINEIVLVEEANCCC
jgi:hypothetical protein